MAKILFKQNIDLCGFNIGTKDISYPPNVNIDNDIEESTQNSLVFSFVGDDMYQNDILYAKYWRNENSGKGNGAFGGRAFGSGWLRHTKRFIRVKIG